MKKIVIGLLVAILLLGPSMPLLAVAVLMNPAATATCTTNTTLTIGAIPDTLTATTTDGNTVTLDRQQLAHAATIITVGSRINRVDRDAILIALMAALTESSLRMLANQQAYPESTTYPHDGDSSDYDSLGLFQMRPQSGWGTVQNLMNPAYQVRAFFGGPTGPNHPSPPGLLDIPNWKSLSKGAAAQAVEVSAQPDRYAIWEPVATIILTTLTTPATDGDNAAGPVLESRTVVFPLPAGTWVMSSPYGDRIHPITHKRTLHEGTDYAAPDGTPILAIADGQVTFAGHQNGYGNAILITHTIDSNPVTSLYGHMWDGHLYVKTGDHVIAGQHIADVGSNGRSTGPHLHFEIRPDSGTPIDPDTWLNQHGATTLDNAATSPTGCYLKDDE